MSMVRALTLNGDPVELDEASLAALRGRLRGPLLTEASEGYAEACVIWNGMIKSRPALIVKATGTADVLECVAFARERELRFSAKCGGHNLAGTSLPDRGLTLDLSRMKGVLIDPVQKIVRVQAGCLLGDVDRETQVHGLATTLGFVSETGVSGLTLGGGFGYLTRRFGWTVDSLLEIEVVTADGQVRRVSADKDPDLFWALRGGGGNFGVATEFTFKLYPVGPRIVGGLIAWPAEQAAGVLDLYRKATASSSRELTMAVTMRLAPPAPFIPKEWHGKPMIGIVACHSGSLADGHRALAPVKAFGEPIADTIVEKTYCQQQMMLDATQPKGLCYYWKSEYLSSLSDGAIEAYRTNGAAVPTPQSQIVMFQLGGALSERPADDGAVGNRDAAFVVGIAGSWVATAPDAIGWVRTAWGQLRPHGTGGVYINFLTEEEGDDRVREAYRDNFERLAQVKAKYDPDNFFRSNKNISPR